MSEQPEAEEDINDFLRQVELLFDCTFLKNNLLPEVIGPGINPAAIGNDYSEPKLPNRESIESFLMRIRPLIVHKERLYIGKVVDFVFENKGNEAMLRRNWYRFALDILRSHRGRVASIGISPLGESHFDGILDQNFWLHFYAKYFHLSRVWRRKRDDLHVWGNVSEQFVLAVLQDYAELAGMVAEDIRRMAQGKSFLELPDIMEISTSRGVAM